MMPKKHSYRGTPMRPIRLDDALWAAALSITKQRSENVSLVIRTSLVDYVTEHEALLGPEERAALDEYLRR